MEDTGACANAVDNRAEITFCADKIVLRKLTIQDEEQMMSLRNEILESDDGEDAFAGCGELRGVANMQEWLDILRRREDEKNVPEGMVPSATYAAVRQSDGRIVGIIDLRYHIDHPILGLWGGHMGYTVRPGERGKGYAKEMLRQNLRNCGARGLNKVMVTCSEANAASERTILANGGIYERTVEVDGDRIKRYWIAVDLVAGSGGK